MLIVQEKLINDAVIKEQFMCNLSACKGACCVAGDYGAPLEEEELAILDKIYEVVRPYISDEGQQVAKEVGKYTYYKKAAEYGTPLLKNGACIYVTHGPKGIAQCGIEKAYNAGLTDFNKPISCHLYPIRINSIPGNGFEVLNYDEWDICSAACELGKKEQMPVYRFVKNALIRKYGAAFYEELDAGAKYIQDKS